MTDLTLRYNGGSIVQASWNTEAGGDFLRNSLASEGWQWLGPWLGIDTRLLSNVLAWAAELGLTFDVEDWN
jgi:hypothetical protein